MATAPTAPTAAAAELPTLSQQVVTAVGQALYDRVMKSLKVSHTATEPPPELLPAELHDVLRLTQQMLNTMALIGTHGEAEFDPHWLVNFTNVVL